ncbi:clan AA aspartic protease [Nostoc sp. LEGE 12450]|uniref:clan AA aspartic protease n=1 Tax=Nostoc sp. LEGE 12450 TaxID=1828643 RepID=UPI00187E9BB1|nr:clan AA aspartic protease [Nostoc sp. LEGE 12450]MBE8989278.1 clan AA aspartic protease [Nostoc sp. LEGE 12450]
MIAGIVNADLEPIISISICGSDGKIYTQDAIVDTGFNGWLSLPPYSIAQLNLRWKRRGRAILRDGSECVFNVYEAVLVWDGDILIIPVDEADSEPLVGMSLMEGYQVMVQVFENGRVERSKVNTV